MISAFYSPFSELPLIFKALSIHTHSSSLPTSIYCLFTHARIWFYMTSKHILLNPAGPSNTVFHQLLWAYVQILEVLWQCLTLTHSSELWDVCLSMYIRLALKSYISISASQELGLMVPPCQASELLTNQFLQEPGLGKTNNLTKNPFTYSSLLQLKYLGGMVRKLSWSGADHAGLEIWEWTLQSCSLTTCVLWHIHTKSEFRQNPKCIHQPTLFLPYLLWLQLFLLFFLSELLDQSPLSFEIRSMLPRLTGNSIDLKHKLPTRYDYQQSWAILPYMCTWKQMSRSR